MQGASGRARRYTHLSCVGLSHGRGGITRSFIIGRGRPHQSTNLCWHKGVGVNEVQGSDEFLNAIGQGRLTGQGRVKGYLPSSSPRYPIGGGVTSLFSTLLPLPGLKSPGLRPYGECPPALLGPSRPPSPCGADSILLFWCALLSAVRRNSYEGWRNSLERTSTLARVDKDPPLPLRMDRGARRCSDRALDLRRVNVRARSHSVCGCEIGQRGAKKPISRFSQVLEDKPKLGRRLCSETIRMIHNDEIRIKCEGNFLSYVDAQLQGMCVAQNV